jgi:hypothetical protein
MSSLSFVLFGSNQLQSADFVLENIRKHYPDNYIALLSDCGADYTNLSKSRTGEYHPDINTDDGFATGP